MLTTHYDSCPDGVGVDAVNSVDAVEVVGTTRMKYYQDCSHEHSHYNFNIYMHAGYKYNAFSR